MTVPGQLAAKQCADPDAWDADRLRDEVAFCVSPAGRLRREDREIAFALEIERLREFEWMYRELCK